MGGESEQHLSPQPGARLEAVWVQGCQRYQATTLSSASFYYGNGDTFSWTEARPALCSRHSPIRANLGNDFSASLYMTHIYLQAFYQVCWLQGIPFKAPRPTAARGPGNIGGGCGWCLKPYSACLGSSLLTVLLTVLMLAVPHAA